MIACATYFLQVGMNLIVLRPRIYSGMVTDYLTFRFLVRSQELSEHLIFRPDFSYFLEYLRESWQIDFTEALAP